MTAVSAKAFSQRAILILILIGIFVIVIVSISAFLLATYSNLPKLDDVDKRPNVVMIVIDDLRPALGCYSDEKAITPNIDQLAEKSILFKNAYAQISSCTSSRASFLMGRRPNSLQVYGPNNNRLKNFTSLPQHFKDNGYETISVGKVFDYDGTDISIDLSQWSRKPYYPPSLETDEICSTEKGDPKNLICPVAPDAIDLPDVEVQEHAVNYLLNKSSNANQSNPFFLAVGFYRPHIPFKFPANYLNLHPIESIEVVANNYKPEGMPNVAWNPWMDFRSKNDVAQLNLSSIDNDPFPVIPKDFQKRIIQAYYTSVSYVDDQVGKLLEGLEISGYASNTVVILLSDHGFSLGEHGEWAKHSNFDVALKVPVLMHVPDMTEPKDSRKQFHHIDVTSIKPDEYVRASAKYSASELIELVDIFPTLSETLNIAVPPMCSEEKVDEEFCSDGISFHPILFDYVYPSMDFSWKSAIFSQYPRPSNFPKNDSDLPTAANIKIMGYTIKDQHFRYTRWVHFNNWLMKSRWGTFEGHELYNVQSDPLEMNNLIDKPDHANTVISMFKKLRKGWRNSLPVGVHNSPMYSTFQKMKAKFRNNISKYTSS